MNPIIKVAITGAAGQLGYALLFRLAAGEVFGKEQKINLNLLELEQALPALEGVLMELEDCAFPFLDKVTITSDPKEAFKDIDWGLLIGSVPRKAGMERADLLKINAKVFVEQGKALNEKAKKTARVLVVGNPCNTNAYIAKTYASNIPARNFFALTMLDQNRAVALLAKKCCSKISEVRNLAIWGNHSLTLFPDFYHAIIRGKPALEICRDEEWFKKDFLARVQTRGAAVIKARGMSSAASAANAVIDTVKSINQKTPPGEFFSAAVCSDGSYGITKDLMFSFPISSDGRNWKIVQGLEHNAFAYEKIRLSEKELQEEIKNVQEFLPLK